MAKGRMLQNRISKSQKLASLSNDTVRLLYTWLLSHLDINGNFYADPVMVNNLVFTRLGHSVKTISNSLDEMAEKGLIVRYKINGEVYLNYPDFNEKQPALNPARETTPEIPNITQESILHDASVTPAQIKISKDNIYNVKNSVKKKEHDANLEQSFTEFWNAYPRKVNKKEAKQKWFKAKLPNLSIILKALAIQKQSESWQKDGGKYIPHPTTWLNQERWNDEITIERIEPNGYQPPLEEILA